MYQCHASFVYDCLLRHEEAMNNIGMKKFGLLAIFIAFAMTMNSQTVHLKEPTVTTFLGIPIDGSKQAMISSLKAKGFR